MSNSIAPSLRAWGLFSAQPGRASGREPVPDSDGRRRSAWSSTDSSFRPRAPWRHGAGVHELVLADVDAHVRGDASAPGGEEHQVAGTQVLLVLDGFALGALLARGAGQFQAGDFAKDMQDQAAAVEALGGVVAAPRIGVPMASRPACTTRSRRVGTVGSCARRRPLRLARAWVVVDSEAWAAPGIQDRVSARRGRTAGRQGGRGGSVFSRRRCHCVTSGNRSGRHGGQGLRHPGKPAERAQRRAVLTGAAALL